MVNIQRIGYKQLRKYLVNAARSASGTSGDDWQDCYFAQAAPMAFLADSAKLVVERILSRQQGNGFTPQSVESGSAELNFHCKPFLAQTLWQEMQSSPIESARYAELLSKIESYLSYYDHHNKSAEGLYSWTMFESGVNSNIETVHIDALHALDNYAVCKNEMSPLLAVDLNCYLAAEFVAFAAINEACGKPNQAARYSLKAYELIRLINKHLWNAEINSFDNLNSKTLQFVGVRAWTGWLPVLLGFADAGYVWPVIVNNVLNEQEFYCSHGLASMSQSEALFSQTAQLMQYGRAVPNWMGPVWVLPNTLAVRFLAKSQWRQSAVDISRRVLNTLCFDLEQNNMLHASYDALTGRPLLAQDSLGFNLLALELLTLVDAQSMAA